MLVYLFTSYRDKCNTFFIIEIHFTKKNKKITISEVFNTHLKWLFIILFANEWFIAPYIRLKIALFYTTPEKPMNAIASKPATINAIGVPFMPAGIFTKLICSRSPANSTSAKPKPIAVEKA